MKVKDVAPNMSFPEIEVEVISVEPERQFEKFGKIGRVTSAIVKDDSGEIKMTLWNDEIDKIKQGMRLRIMKGYCKEWNGERQISIGKFGSFEVLE